MPGPDDESLAVARGDGTVTLHDLTGAVVVSFGGFATGMTFARFSADGNHLVTIGCSNAGQGGCLERSIHTWDPNGPLLMSESRRTGAFAVQPRQPDMLEISRSGTLVFAATSNEPAHIWNTRTGERIELPGVRLVEQAAFDPDETRLMTIDDRAVQVHDLSGRLLNRLQRGADSEVAGAILRASREGLIALGRGDDTALGLEPRRRPPFGGTRERRRLHRGEPCR